MTEIKTAQAWGWIDDGRLFSGWTSENCKNTPVVIVHGLTETEVHEAAGLLDKSREVCEWEEIIEWVPGANRWGTTCGKLVGEDCEIGTTFCPSCGRKVKII